MSHLIRPDDRRAAAGAVPAGVVAGEITGANLYLTNGVFLYRVVGMAATGMGQMVELEDCYSLNVALVPIGALRAGGLRVVQPERAAD